MEKIPEHKFNEAIDEIAMSIDLIDGPLGCRLQAAVNAIGQILQMRVDGGR